MIPEGTRGQGFKGSSEMLKNYKDLKVWQKSYELCLEIYRITAKFPKEERYVFAKTTTQEVPLNPFAAFPSEQNFDMYYHLKISILNITF